MVMYCRPWKTKGMQLSSWFGLTVFIRIIFVVYRLFGSPRSGFWSWNYSCWKCACFVSPECGIAFRGSDVVLMHHVACLRVAKAENKIIKDALGSMVQRIMVRVRRSTQVLPHAVF